jgi:hypothetical protein
VHRKTSVAASGRASDEAAVTAGALALSPRTAASPFGESETVVPPPGRRGAALKPSRQQERPMMDTEELQVQMQRSAAETPNAYHDRLVALMRETRLEAETANELANHLASLLLAAIRKNSSSETLTQLRRSISDAMWCRSIARAHLNLIEIRLVWLRSEFEK